jgi:hypothetical protein
MSTRPHGAGRSTIETPGSNGSLPIGMTQQQQTNNGKNKQGFHMYGLCPKKAKGLPYN